DKAVDGTQPRAEAPGMKPSHVCMGDGDDNPYEVQVMWMMTIEDDGYYLGGEKHVRCYAGDADLYGHSVAGKGGE
ncbi:hypothetical protein ACLOJK_034459, partial [Asimina triloba]